MPRICGEGAEDLHLTILFRREVQILCTPIAGHKSAAVLRSSYF